MASLTPDQIKVLDQSRHRLMQLDRSLASLLTSLNESNPFPPWYARAQHTPPPPEHQLTRTTRNNFQSQATIISNNLSNVSEHLSANHDLLSTLVAYPGPDYPGRTQANILEQLLRTKLDPRVEDWVARGRIAGTERSTLNDSASQPNPSSVAAVPPAGKTLSEAELDELWAWAPIAANTEAKRRNWFGNYTLEERESGIENVKTGLRRQLEDDAGDEEEEDEEDEEGEDEMEVVGVHRKSGGGAGFEFDIAVHHKHAVKPVVPLPDILRYMTTGRMP